MNFQVEVNLDYLEGAAGEEFESQLLASLVEKITEEAKAGIVDRVIASAEKVIGEKTELLINTVLEGPLVISTGWNKEERYDSIFDMIEERFTDLYKGKLDVSGTCKKDPLLATLDAHIKTQATAVLQSVERAIASHAAKQTKKEIEEHELIKALGVVIGEDSRGRHTAKIGN